MDINKLELKEARQAAMNIKETYACNDIERRMADIWIELINAELTSRAEIKATKDGDEQ